MVVVRHARFNWCISQTLMGFSRTTIRPSLDFLRELGQSPFQLFDVFKLLLLA